MPYELQSPKWSSLPAVAEAPAIKCTVEELDRLKQNMHTRLSPNTKRAYETGLRQWRMFCHTRNVSWFPARPEHVALWLSGMVDQGLKLETVKQRAKAISYIHREQGAADPTNNEMVKDAIRACPNNRANRATAVDENHFDSMLYSASRRDRALLLVMRWLMLRPSEAAALRWDEIDFDRGLILIAQSKTDQRGEGVWMYMPLSVQDALEEWKRKAPRRVKVFGLTPNSVSRVVRRLGERAGLEGVSGHSMRRGMACDLVSRGEPIGEIMVAGRWESPQMVARYAEEVAATGALARYAKETA